MVTSGLKTLRCHCSVGVVEHLHVKVTLKDVLNKANVKDKSARVWMEDAHVNESSGWYLLRPVLLSCNVMRVMREMGIVLFDLAFVQ